MSWDPIDNLSPNRLPATIPPTGIRISTHALNQRRKGVSFKQVRYIKIQIGPDLAHSLSLRAAQTMVQLLFGSEDNRGKIKLRVDADVGNFVARRNRAGAYSLTISKASAEGLFSLNFPAYEIPSVTAQPAANGQAANCIFRASPAMLSVED